MSGRTVFFEFDLNFQLFQEFGYDDSIKGIMLSSFFWGYIVTQVPGAYLAQSKFGAKKTVGFGLLIASVFTMITPFAAYNKTLLLAARVLTGTFI